MKKFATFLTFGAVLAVGLPGQALAAQVVTVQCTTFNPNQHVSAIANNVGTTRPPSCFASGSCAQCVADLLSNGFKLANSFNVVQSTTLYSGPYFVLTK